MDTLAASFGPEIRVDFGAELRVAFAVPGDLSARTGGYGYDRRILTEPVSDMQYTHIALPDGFPNPSPDAMRQTARLLQAVPPHHVLLIDGLACGVLPEALLACLHAPVVALLHHPLGLETGLGPSERARLLAGEARALRHVRHGIVTSALTARLVTQELGFPAARITVAEPGTDSAPRAKGSGGYPAVLFAAGSIIPRKGYDVLVSALARLADIDWHLVLAGSPERAPGAARALVAQIEALGLAGRVTLRGDLAPAELNAAYDRADIFVLSSHFEGYGMVLAEAMARGLPVVTTRGGAAAETVADAASLKVPPGDVPALALALRRMITDKALRESCADESWRAGQSLPRWADTARIVAKALRAAARR